MDDFKKIDLDQLNSSKDLPHIKIKKGFSIVKISKVSVNILILIILLGLLSLTTVLMPAQQVYRSAMKTKSQAIIAVNALKKQNIELGSTELDKTKKDLTQTQKDLYKMSYLQYVPFINGYYNDANHLIKAAFNGLNAGIILIESIKPYADVLGLKGQGSFVLGSAEQRIQLAVRTMGKITPRIDDIADLVKDAELEIDKVDSNHYPRFIDNGKIKIQLEQARQYLNQAVNFTNKARPLIKVLPNLLGETKEKRYLVLFQNDKELRPTGGFMTAYAVFRIDKGIINVDKSDDIYTLDNSISIHPKAPASILKYLPKENVLNLRNSNISPDFIESMKIFNSMYEKSSLKTNIDGIIAIDTNVLVDTIRILDDEVNAGGLRFTSKTDSRCDCPQVIYELENNISRPVNYVKTARKDLLGSLLYAIMGKALKSSPKIYWGSLFQEFITQVNEKHVLFYLFDKDAQKGVEALNAAGKILPFNGDYLHINEANFGGAKSNLFVRESVMQSIDRNNDGTIVKTITIEYKNPHKPSNCDLEAGQLCLNALLRDWIRIYVPKGSELISSQGSEVKIITTEDLGKTVFEGFITVKPLGFAVYTLKYKLPFKIKNDGTLPLLIQKQPGTSGNEYIIKVNGKKIESFPLLTDKEIILYP
ncbi:MAG: DUF4012 domain-containing protein [Candidatus Levybacteria bacterium]|nr:DUF4012 domain-containing protein [Candidatus Levybacteria bacterium]